jgi:hypothetical protein
MIRTTQREGKNAKSVTNIESISDEGTRLTIRQYCLF